MKPLTATSVVAHALFAFALIAAEPTKVSIINIVANPEAYDGKLIFIEGVLSIEYEADALFLHKEDWTYSIWRNGLWLTLSEEQRRKWRKYDGRHVSLIGRVNAHDQGHFATYAAALRDIEDIQPARRRPNRRPSRE